MARRRSKYDVEIQEWRYRVGIDPMPEPPKDVYTPPERDAVYFIGDEGAIKIGFAAHPEIRMENLQSGNPRQLILLGSYRRRDARAEERRLHRQFAAYRIRGEWFRDSPELRAVIAARCPANDNAKIVVAA